MGIFDFLLHCRDLRLALRSDRIAERSGLLLIQVVMRGVIIWYARNVLDGAQEGS